MRTKVLLTLAVVAMLALGGAVMASNMGFKISIPLTAGQVKYISLPYYCTLDGQALDGVNAKAANLRNEVIAAGGTTVQVWNWTGTALQRYAGGGIGQVNFVLQPGIGYEVSSVAAVPGWIVVGSHNPSLSIPLTAGQVKILSVPYHTTSANAAALRNELIAAGGTTVQVWDWTGTTLQRYAGGGIGQVNFTITPGKAYQASSVAAVAGWTPAHY